MIRGLSILLGKILLGSPPLPFKLRERYTLTPFTMQESYEANGFFGILFMGAFA